jgi:hypothetical protein
VHEGVPLQVDFVGATRMTHLLSFSLSSCVAVALLFSWRADSAHGQETPRIQFPPMTREEVERFRDSLKNSVALVSRSPRQSERADSNTEGVWAGSKTDVQTNIDEVVLRFRPSTGEALEPQVVDPSRAVEDKPKEPLEYVDVRLSYKHPHVTFIHSHTQEGRESGGFAAKVVRRDISTRVRMIGGQRESSMYVAVPPFHNPGELWGVYVCPRSITRQSVGRTGTRVVSLSQSPYTLSEVKLSARAVGSATFEASRGKVKAGVSLQLSSDMPASVDTTDLSIAVVAEPRVLYRPKGPFDFFSFAPHSDIQQGVNMVVELQNRSGKIRRQNFSHVLSVHRSTEPSPVSVTVNGVRPASDAGECYIVQVQRYSWNEFSAGAVDF